MSAVPLQVLDEAIGWQLCLGSGEASPQDYQAFSAWLAQHPEHLRVWQQLGELDQQLGIATPAPARRALLARPNRRIPRSALGLLLALGLSLGLLNSQRPLSDYLADERTGSGEIRELQLPDHTQVTLNSRSAMDIQFDEHERRVFLRSGEILVETAHGDARPFLVVTEQGSLRALGTRFLVRREGDATRLVVLQSAVAAHAQQLPAERVIDAGQQVLMRRDELGQTTPAPLGAGAWSNGMLVADNLRLADLLASLDEYRPGYLSVDPRIADLRISGSFPLRDSELALAALPPSLPVRIERYTNWWVKVVPAQP
ncbi:FecR domain-containing protein [Aquipseudomonas alcaligenes]|uniref:FecR domain-containing protein n=1 Tax=Aquipseudomonas alcaligenes TaxID=43263 RepID=UPI0037491C32